MSQALSIQQPWAELILRGLKSIELRTWTTDYRGKLWIHTGQKANPDLDRQFQLSGLFRGGYVGVATLEHIHPLDSDKWARWQRQHLDEGAYQQGFHGWILSNPIRFEDPVSAPGQLGLFAPPPDVEQRLLAAEQRAAEGQQRGS